MTNETIEDLRGAVNNGMHLSPAAGKRLLKAYDRVEQRNTILRGKLEVKDHGMQDLAKEVHRHRAALEAWGRYLRTSYVDDRKEATELTKAALKNRRRAAPPPKSEGGDEEWRHDGAGLRELCEECTPSGKPHNHPAPPDGKSAEVRDRRDRPPASAGSNPDADSAAVVSAEPQSGGAPWVKIVDAECGCDENQWCMECVDRG